MAGIYKTRRTTSLLSQPLKMIFCFFDTWILYLNWTRNSQTYGRPLVYSTIVLSIGETLLVFYLLADSIVVVACKLSTIYDGINMTFTFDTIEK